MAVGVGQIGKVVVLYGDTAVSGEETGKVVGTVVVIIGDGVVHGAFFFVENDHGIHGVAYRSGVTQIVSVDDLFQNGGIGPVPGEVAALSHGHEPSGLSLGHNCAERSAELSESVCG